MKKFILLTAIPFMLFTILFTNSDATPINYFINSVSPKQNETSAGKSDNINITFNQPMNGTTFTSANIKVYGNWSGSISAGLAYNSITKILTIDPSDDFKNGEDISVTLTSGIMTTSAMPITPFVYKFTVKTIGGNGLFTVSSMLDPSLGIVYTGDLDNDNDLDVVGVYNDSTKIYKNNGAAVFTLSSSIPRGSEAVLSDLNNDGSIDLLIYKNDSLHYYVNDGSGNFSYVSSVKGRAGKTGDLNGDGFQDLAYQNLTETVALKNISGALTQLSATPFTICNGFIQYSGLSINDFNNDGYTDISTLTDCYNVLFGLANGERKVDILFNSPSTVFTKKSALSTGFGGTEPIAQMMAANMTSFDYNNDNLTDIVASSNKLTNGGYENFLPSDMEAFYFQPFAGDFNGDGFIDIATQRTNPAYDFNTTLRILLSDGAGHFTTIVNYLIPMYFCVPGDFDGDGDLDLIALSDHAYVLLNNNCPGVSPEIEGTPEAVTGVNYVFTNETGGDWALDNFSTNASIVGSTTGDSVIVNSGTAYGAFRVIVKMSDGCGGAAISTKFVNVSNCLISGNANTEIGQIEVYRAGSNPLAHWELYSEIPGAAIIGAINNDSVVINTGSTGGDITLVYTTGVYPSCRFSVFVDAPLPVELASFTSVINGPDVTLQWSTASEDNNRGFYIERILNGSGNEWIEKGFVTGNGTTNAVSNYVYRDNDLASGTYKYRLKQTDYNGNFKYHDLGSEVVIGIPDKYSLSQNYPNPFNPSTTVNFEIPVPGIVSIRIFDISGKKVSNVINEFKEAGYHSVQFRADGLSSGIYFYRLTSGDFVQTRKMMVLK